MGNPSIDLEGAANFAALWFGGMYGGAAFMKLWDQMGDENEKEVTEAVEIEDPRRTYYTFGDAMPGSIYTTQ